MLPTLLSFKIKPVKSFASFITIISLTVSSCSILPEPQAPASLGANTQTNDDVDGENILPGVTIIGTTPDFGYEPISIPGGGDGGYYGGAADTPTSDGGGGSGGSTQPGSPPPCQTLTNNGQNTAIQNKFKELKSLVHDNKEHAFGTYRDASGNITFNQVVGEPGAGSVNITSQTKGIDSFTHTHYDGLNSIFSTGDLLGMANLYQQGLMKNSSTFTMNVITSQGTVYSVVITDRSAYSKFIDANFTNTAAYTEFERAYTTYNGISPTNTVEKNELGFLKLLSDAKSGLTLYKGNPDNFSSWKKISQNNGQINSTPCQ